MNWFYGMSEALRALAGMDKMEFYTLLGVVVLLAIFWLARYSYEWWVRHQIAKDQQKTFKTLGGMGVLVFFLSMFKK